MGGMKERDINVASDGNERNSNNDFRRGKKEIERQRREYETFFLMF